VDAGRPLHPRQVLVWTVGGALGCVVPVAVVLVAELLVGAADRLPWPRGTATVAVVVIAAAAVATLPRAAYRRWRWELAEETLELRRGLVVRTETAIPYFRVQHIDITRSPVERALGVSQLTVRTAAATTDAVLPGIAAEEAEALRDRILQRAGDDAL